MVKLNYGIALECVSLYFGHICIRGLYMCPNCPKNDPKCIRPCILQPLIRCYAQESNSIRSNSVFGSWSTAQLIHLPDPLTPAYSLTRWAPSETNKLSAPVSRQKRSRSKPIFFAFVRTFYFTKTVFSSSEKFFSAVNDF